MDDHRTIDPRIQQRVNPCERSQTAADLQPDPAARSEIQDDFAIRLIAIARAVEIDDVHGASAKLAIAFELCVEVG